MASGLCIKSCPSKADLASTTDWIGDNCAKPDGTTACGSLPEGLVYPSKAFGQICYPDKDEDHTDRIKVHVDKLT